MSPSQLERIMNKVRSIMKIDNDCEVTIEMDPGTFDRLKIRQYKDLGINRMSMGVQTFNVNEFQTLGRGHSYS
jgi:coproporphyrinogen III oxidase-like Fe-S oxidoreductase